MEIFVDDDTKLTLHGLQQYYIRLDEADKNKKLNDLLEPEYQWMPDGKSDGWQGIDRFIPTDKG
mgnify:CR=1 FL=1